MVLLIQVKVYVYLRFQVFTWNTGRDGTGQGEESHTYVFPCFGVIVFSIQIYFFHAPFHLMHNRSLLPFLKFVLQSNLRQSSSSQTVSFPRTAIAFFLQFIPGFKRLSIGRDRKVTYLPSGRDETASGNQYLVFLYMFPV